MKKTLIIIILLFSLLTLPISAKNPVFRFHAKRIKPVKGEVLTWNIDRIDAEQSWSTTSGEGISVAFLDTGIDRDHPDLIDNIVGGVNVLPNKKGIINLDDWGDDYGHGTWVA